MIDLFAYIDPASTALIWQILAGVFIAFGVVIGIWRTKIVTFFKSVWAKTFGKKKAAEQNAEKSEEDDELSDEVEKICDESENIETYNDSERDELSEETKG